MGGGVSTEGVWFVARFGVREFCKAVDLYVGAYLDGSFGVVSLLIQA